MDTVAGLQRLLVAKRTVVTANDLRLVLGIRNTHSLHMRLKRLVARGRLKRLAKGLFACAGVAPDPFELANLARRPSYISLESALNLHGLLIQTPRMITSVTTSRPGRLHIGGHELIYRHIHPRLWSGFDRNGAFLLATPEKAFLDWLYLVSRSDRPRLLDDLAWKRLNKRLLDKWAAAVPSRAFQKAYRQWLR